MFREKNVSSIISYLTLRKLIGILGVLLPLFCLVGGFLFAKLKLQPSISDYYHTNVRDIFVGLLIAVSLFLLTYRGYEVIDSIVSTACGIAGFGIAIFPCLSSSTSNVLVSFFQIDPNIASIIHFTCAGIFFILLAVNSLFLFTLTDKTKEISKNKKKRNIIYKVCGTIILLSILVFVIIQFVTDKTFIEKWKIIFILETIMLLAFGISWLVKGDTILIDPIGKNGQKLDKK